jgi:erythromycin esterase-like protein
MRRVDHSMLDEPPVPPALYWEVESHHRVRAKTIVWEHNTPVGDARYTDMAEEGMVNVGQLVRDAPGTKDVVAVGFGSYRGDVIAGRQWEAPLERMRVPPARPSSWEHECDEPRVDGGWR